MKTKHLFDDEIKTEFPVETPLLHGEQVTREEALSGSPEQKQLYFENVAVHVEGFAKARRFVDALFDRSKRSVHPGGLWITGEGGVGKSFILNDIYRRYPSLDTNVARITPLIWVSFRGKPVESDLLNTMLLQLGQDPSLIVGETNKDLEDRLVEGLNSCGTVGVLFDEAQHLWIPTSGKRNADRLGGRIGDMLKRVYQNTRVAYIFSGAPGLTEAVIHDKQIRTRWPGVLSLSEFSLDEKFYGLLAALDQAIPLPEMAGLAHPKFAEPIYSSVEGNFRLTKDLLGNATFLAAQESSARLEMKHLAEAHFTMFCDRDNPFE